MPKKHDKDFVIPEIIIDPKTSIKYDKGSLLGLGGFAKCYELKENKCHNVYAGKIVSKKVLVRDSQKEKMSQEISIHKSLSHRNIVHFYSYFEDVHNVYIILELCKKKSLMELHKRRRSITEPETRYFMRQIFEAVRYLHENKIIHRDLKLGNLFINEEMELKVGDFGLATKLEYEGERKKTLCGTPNYIAPEVLHKKGHSYEVDMWSLGCIMYTLLVGKPPFETESLQDTYRKIKRVEYFIPESVSSPARRLITKLLQGDPAKRPNIQQAAKDEFMMGYTPSRLPVSCLTMAPRQDNLQNLSHMVPAFQRKPLSDVNTVSNRTPTKGKENAGQNAVPNPSQAAMPPPKLERVNDDIKYLKDLNTQLRSVVTSRPAERDNPNEDEAEDPQLSPLVWISKWVDYSDKYGLGYQLSDDSQGVMFNDNTKLLLLHNKEDIHYIDSSGKEYYHNINNHPKEFSKKVTLLKYFVQYMSDHLLKTGAEHATREGDELSRIPYLRSWFRTRSAIVMHLTNGTLQLNFFEDHTKIIVCPLLKAITYINEQGEFRTFSLAGIEEHGCGEQLNSRIRYALLMVERFLNSKSGSSKSRKAAATNQ